jgi:hypothetical protein
MQGRCALTTDTLDRLAPELELMVEKKTENKTPSGVAKTRGIIVSVEKGTAATACKQAAKNQRKISHL